MAPTASNDRVRTDWLPSILAGVFQLATAVMLFYPAVFFSEELGFSGRQIGFLYAVQAVTGVLVAFPAGIESDRFTSRNLLLIGLLIQALGCALMGIVRGFWIFVLVIFVWSFAFNLCRLSFDIQILKAGSENRIATRLGLYHAWRFIGLTVGTILTGYLVAWVDFTTSLFVVAVVCLSLEFFAIRLVPTPVEKASWSQYRADLADPQVVFFAIWMFLFASHWGAEGTSYALFLRKELSLSLSEMGWYMGAEFLVMVPTVLLAARYMKDPKVFRRIAVAGLLTSGIGLIGMIFKPPALSVSFRVLHGIGDGLMLLVLFFGIFKLFAIERLGGNTGFITTVNMLGYVAGSLVYGSLGESLGYALPLWTSGVLTLLLISPLLIGRRLHTVV